MSNLVSIVSLNANKVFSFYPISFPLAGARVSKVALIDIVPSEFWVSPKVRFLVIMIL